MNFVVGTDLAHMVGKSIVAARRHRALGHVDIKLGLIMVVSTVVGVEGGARAIEALKAAGTVDLVVGVSYVLILLTISILSAWESLQALRMVRTDQLYAREVVGFRGVERRIHGIALRPLISLPGSGIEAISVWVVLLVGLFTGFLAATLGVGGVFCACPIAGVRPGNPHARGCRNRSVRNCDLGWLRDTDTRD